MKSLVILLTLAFSLKAEIKNFSQAKKLVAKVKKVELMKELRSFVHSAKPNRFFSTPGHLKAREYIESKLNSIADKSDIIKLKKIPFSLNVAAGQKFYQDDFNRQIEGKFKPESAEYKKWSSFTVYMKSLIAKKSGVKGLNYELKFKGTIDKEIILLAHYDTVSHDKKSFRVNEKAVMPGADYNASGVNLLLHYARILSDFKPYYTVKFVFLDAASLGFLGAFDYAQNHRTDDLIGVVNLEMLGHDSVVFDKLKKSKNMKVYLRDKRKDPKGEDEIFLQSFERFKKKSPQKRLFALEKNSLDSSDHMRFWEVSVPAIMYSQNWEDDFNAKKYQTSNDIPETINQSTYHSAYSYIGSMLLGFALNLNK